MESKWVEAADYSRTAVLDPTAMDTETRNLHDNSDVASYHNHYGTNWYGMTDCIDRDGRICLHWHEKFNADYSHDLQEKKSLTCHEFGHTTGLNHYAVHQDYDGTCMETPHWHIDFNSHDIGHINDYYA